MHKEHACGMWTRHWDHQSDALRVTVRVNMPKKTQMTVDLGMVIALPGKKARTIVDLQTTILDQKMMITFLEKKGKRMIYQDAVVVAGKLDRYTNATYAKGTCMYSVVEPLEKRGMVPRSVARNVITRVELQINNKLISS